MDDALLGIVLQRLGEDALGQEATDLLLAAMEDPETLSAQLEGAVAAAQPRTAAHPDTARPEGAYLRSLTVSGFRGVGPPASLSLAPGPGLTIVAGRNGSGKSSFAEALEVLLTGSLRRWADKPKVWQDGWRCLHSRGSAEITAEVILDGTGLAEVRRVWDERAGLADSSVSVQVAGEKRTGLDRLGWDDALVSYRPFLSHAELEAFFGSPSGLYDLLASVLGLDDLTVAADRLADARRKREAALKDLRTRLPALLGRLHAADDERAGRCHAALAGRTWDLAAARAAVAGAPPADGGELGRLRRLVQLASPEPGLVTTAVRALREAADQFDAVAGTESGRARDLADLLTTALAHHAAHGDGDCPVCGRRSALTTQWRDATRQQVTRLRREAEVADAASRTGAEAGRRARALILPPPAFLAEEPPAGLDAEPARDAWARWAIPALAQPGEVPDSDLATPSEAAGAGPLRALASHLESTSPPLSQALDALSRTAAAKLKERDDRWAPVAAEVAAWVTDAQRAQEALHPVAAIQQAEKWLKQATDEVRNARLAPLSDHAREIWAMLRQESSVDLGAIRLSGSATRRQVDLDVSVDGATGSALGVMSQGEVNALALAVFLPRATMPQSPFRFLIIDDPVQAMDPAKVDGLARVLERAATDRQVVVFTHDNRLPESIRYLGIAATILEVTRRPNCVVDIRACTDPVRQALQDAGALAADQSVPADVAARVVPGLCRTAVEAAFTAAIWCQQLRHGRPRADIEAELAAANRRLTTIAALAMFGDAGRGGDVLPRLQAWGGRYARTYKELNKGTHTGHDGDLGHQVGGARQLATKIETTLQ